MIRTTSLAAAITLAACAGPARRQSDLPLLIDDDLDSAAALAAFACSDADCWRIGTDPQGGPCLQLAEGSRYQPPHRSPLGLAIRRAPAVLDFDLDVDARQTGREYPHRDLCIVFAFRDADHFAYAHLASAADDNAHQIMLVDGADRRPVTTARTAGVSWGDGWHHLRVRRRGTRVQVFFDDAATAVLTGEVPVWPGCIGLGSFDDAGSFRALRLCGVEAPWELPGQPFAAAAR